MATYTNTFGVFKPHEKSKYQNNVNNYGEWLNSFEWDYYCTLTTDYPMSLPAARRAMNRFHNFLQENYNQASVFWVAEPFDSRVSYHTHALVKIANSQKNGFKAIRKAWEVTSKSQRNYTLIQSYVKSKGANFYVAKYLSRNSTDYDILI